MTAVYLLIAATAAALLIRGFWETWSLQTTHVHIGDRGKSDPLRVVLFSDLHAEHLRLKSSRIITEIKQAAPDVVVFAGDLTARMTRLAKAIEFMRQIRESEYGRPVFFLAVPGNHDTPEALQALAETGFLVLENDTASYRHNSSLWQFYGMADIKNGQPAAASLPSADGISAVAPERRIVIAHNPDRILELPEESALLFLAGHFHGGQIWAPFRLEYKILRDEKLASMGYTRGLFTLRGIQAYISRGIGCVLIPLRFMSRPELTIIDIW